MGTFFFFVAMAPLVSRGLPRIWALFPSFLFYVLAVIRPATLSRLNRAWTGFGLLLHKITNPLLLGIIFFMVLTPIGLLLRLAGKSTIPLRKDPEADSYWIERQAPATGKQSMTNQF